MTAQTGEPPLTGLRTVVTGASSGIGRAIAIAFSATGARVGIGFCRSSDAAQALADQLGGDGKNPLLQADLGTPEGCTSIVDAAFSAFEHVDVWVNNAGADVLTGEAKSWTDERKLEALIDVDLKATIRCSRLVAGRMRRGGSIINIGWDRATIDGMAGDNPELFAAVKGGVLGFSKSLARSVAPDVRVNVLCPGWVETAYGAGVDRAFYDKVAKATPLGRWGQPEDIAGAAVWLASPAAAFVTGQAVNVNGGAVG
ncbi:MAG TPA: SDR family oxidoreductase [Solirubrobacteraceae bacterium]|nr:SDR family oxidoreductase [Solirubrobacteraceae bacterium]